MRDRGRLTESESYLYRCPSSRPDPFASDAGDHGTHKIVGQERDADLAQHGIRIGSEARAHLQIASGRALDHGRHAEARALHALQVSSGSLVLPVRSRELDPAPVASQVTLPKRARSPASSTLLVHTASGPPSPFTRVHDCRVAGDDELILTAEHECAHLPLVHVRHQSRVVIGVHCVHATFDARAHVGTAVVRKRKARVVLVAVVQQLVGRAVARELVQRALHPWSWAPSSSAEPGCPRPCCGWAGCYRT